MNPLCNLINPIPQTIVLACGRLSTRLIHAVSDRGKTLSISAKGNLTEKVEEGAKVHLQVKYGLITLINQEADLCEQVGQVDLKCPLDKGELKLTKDVELPNEIPPVRSIFNPTVDEGL